MHFSLMAQKNVLIIANLFLPQKKKIEKQNRQQTGFLLVTNLVLMMCPLTVGNNG